MRIGNTFARMEFSDPTPPPVRLTPKEAWDDFMAKYARIRPGARKPLRHMTRKISQAKQDAAGKRVRKTGTPLGLGADRIARILLAASEAMPEVFHYTHHTEEWFEVGQPPR